MSLKPMMSPLVLHHDLTGPHLPTQKYVLTLFGHHDYPPEPWEYLDKMLDATQHGGVLGFIFATMVIEAPTSAVLIYLSRKGEALPSDYQTLKHREYLYELTKEFCMRAAMPMMDGVEPIMRAINNRFIANRIYLASLNS